MFETVLVLLALVLGAMVVVWRRASTPMNEAPPGAGTESIRAAPLANSHPWSPWLVATAIAFGLSAGWRLPWWIAIAIAMTAGIALSILFRFLAARKIDQLESELADALDLMVSSLRAGGGLTDALSSAARESGRLFRVYIQELVERIRLGEEPRAALADLESRVPLESFRLFTFTLTTHWEGGGSLATTLSNVGRTIRDRVAVARRIRSQAVETQVSVIGVLVVTYGLAFLMWQNYPERLGTFAQSEIGSMFIALSIALQGIGLLWISQLTRIEV